jgi:hypothetical protein
MELDKDKNLSKITHNRRYDCTCLFIFSNYYHRLKNLSEKFICLPQVCRLFKALNSFIKYTKQINKHLTNKALCLQMPDKVRWFAHIF